MKQGCFVAVATFFLLSSGSKVFAQDLSCFASPKKVNEAGEYVTWEYQNRCGAIVHLHWARKKPGGGTETGTWLVDRCQTKPEKHLHFAGEYTFQAEIDEKGENRRCLSKEDVAGQEDASSGKTQQPARPSPPAPPPPRRGEQSATVNIESNNPSDRKTTVTMQVRLRTSGQRVRQGKVYPINKTGPLTYYVTMVGDVMTIVQQSKGERSRHQCGRERQINSIAMDNGVTAMLVTCSYVQQGDVYTATWAGKFTDTRMKLGDRGSHNGELRFSFNSQGCKILGGGHHVEWFISNTSDMKPFEEMSNTEIIEGGTCQRVVEFAIGQQPSINGWTDITPSSYTKIIYVSSSTGNDSTCAPASPPVNPAGVTPCKTIRRGKSFMRDGYPDWLLLKKGDTWTNEAIGDICINGRSGKEPALFSSYGTGARPLIKTGSGQTGFSTTWKCGTKGDKLAVVGLEFYAYTRDPANPAFSSTDAAGLPVGMLFLTPISYLLLEDNKVTFYGQNVMIEPPGNSSNAYIRRNIVANAYTSSGAGSCCDYMSTGLYIVGFKSGITFFENLFDHNGWNDTVPGAIADVFRHNYYIKEGGPPASFIGNMSTNDASGAQGRTGGTFTNNLYVKDPIATNYNISHGGSFSNNVILNSNDLPRDGSCRGSGIGFNSGGASPGTQVSGNIIAHQTSSCTDWPAIDIQSGLTGMTITNNIIYQWKTGISGSLAGNTINNNDIDLAGANTAHYSDPNRTVETYDRDVLGGPGTLAHFLSLAKNQSRDNWNSALTAAAVNDYIREGFGIKVEFRR